MTYKENYFKLLEEKFPNPMAIQTEIMNLEAILALPKGTEHFISDLHGEYESFRHLINNCSGVIREKIDLLFKDLSETAKNELATLIYYPEEKLELLEKEGKLKASFYHQTLSQLINLTSLISSKYTRSKVKKAIRAPYAYIIDELIHTKETQEQNVKDYFENILGSMIRNKAAKSYVIEFARLIKQLAVDELHVTGDIFDRGSGPDKIFEILMKHHNIDFEWGNHDVLWIGAAQGIPTCVFYVLYNNLKYTNYSVLENAYGISLRELFNYANLLYHNHQSVINPVVKTVATILFKLEGEIIQRNPEFKLDSRLVLNNINYQNKTYTLDGKTYPLVDGDLLNIDPVNPYQLNQVEKELVAIMCTNFKNSLTLHKHLKFMIEKGSVYKVHNHNLLYHGCIPLDDAGEFVEVNINGRSLKGKAYLDAIDQLIRKVFEGRANLKERDYMYYLWNGYNSPFTGRTYKTFELLFLKDKEAQKESRNPYYDYRDNEDICLKIFKEFGLDANSHIINGHLPVKAKNGESPVMAQGKLIIIDGGFCAAYHQKTGIAGYTLIANSHGLRIKSHSEFTTLSDVLKNNSDIISDSVIIETAPKRILVGDTDNGHLIKEEVKNLKKLLKQKFNEN